MKEIQVEVTQADRNLAYSLLFFAAKSELERRAIEYIRDGKGDDARAVQEIAHHRLAAIAAVLQDLEAIASGLIDQQDEPGTESDRLHYWRDKAINAARALSQYRKEQAND